MDLFVNLFVNCKIVKKGYCLYFCGGSCKGNRLFHSYCSPVLESNALFIVQRT